MNEEDGSSNPQPHTMIDYARIEQSIFGHNRSSSGAVHKQHQPLTRGMGDLPKGDVTP